MAKVVKRGKNWQIDYFDPLGKRIRKAFKKKKDAEAELAKRKALIAEDRYLDVKPEYKKAFGELLEKYKEHCKDEKSFNSGKSYYIERFREYFGDDKSLSSFNYYEVENYKNKLKRKPTKKGTLPTESTVNSEMSCLIHMFKKARQWKMVSESPFTGEDSLINTPNNKRKRYLKKDEIQKLLAECAPHLRNIVECVLHTGMRRKEVLGLKWEQVRGGFIYLQKTKTNTAREIPINDSLALLFQKIRKEQQLRSQYVFTYAQSEDRLVSLKPVRERKKAAPVPQQIKSIKSGYASAKRRAGIENFTFHDLRHTFASHFVMAGGSLTALQQILGHKDIQTTMRYAHLSPDHKTKAVNLLNGLTAPAEKPTCHKTVTKSNSQISASM